MLIQWLADNVFSVLILAAVVAVLAFLAFRMYKDHKAAKSSPTPGCFGCPNAKKCRGGCSCTTPDAEAAGKSKNTSE